MFDIHYSITSVSFSLSRVTTLTLRGHSEKEDVVGSAIIRQQYPCAGMALVLLARWCTIHDPWRIATSDKFTRAWGSVLRFRYLYIINLVMYSIELCQKLPKIIKLLKMSKLLREVPICMSS